MNPRILHFIGTAVFYGIILGTPFTVQALANNIHAKQIQKKDADDKKQKKDQDQNKNKQVHEDCDKDDTCKQKKETPEKPHEDCDKDDSCKSKVITIIKNPQPHAPVQIIHIIHQPVTEQQ